MGAVNFWVVVGGGSARANKGLRGTRVCRRWVCETVGRGCGSRLHGRTLLLRRRPSPIAGLREREKLPASVPRERRREGERERGEKERIKVKKNVFF